MMKHNRPLRTHRAALLVFTAFLILLTAGCRSVPKSAPGGSVLISTEIPHPAIIVETYRDDAYPLTYHLITVDLADESISLVADPLPVEETVAGCVKGEKTSAFAKRTGAIIAVNATPFSIPEGKNRFTTGDRKLEGLFIADGQQFSTPVERYAALGFTKGRQAFILESQAEPLPEDTAVVFGGFWAILKDGEHTGDFKNIQDSRTAVGINSSGTTLFILSVEGEKSLSSRGLSYYDCACILLEKGAADAVELDGGSSTSLIIQGKNALSYPASRIVANSFGFISDRSVY